VVQHQSLGLKRDARNGIWKLQEERGVRPDHTQEFRRPGRQNGTSPDDTKRQIARGGQLRRRRKTPDRKKKRVLNGRTEVEERTRPELVRCKKKRGGTTRSRLILDGEEKKRELQGGGAQTKRSQISREINRRGNLQHPQRPKNTEVKPRPGVLQVSRERFGDTINFNHGCTLQNIKK